MALEDLIKTVEHNPVFPTLIQKRFTSICPNGVEISMKVGNKVVGEKPSFTKYVINKIWVAEIEKGHWWAQITGYFVVTYIRSSDVYYEWIPYVLDPRVYTLIWDTDPNGARKYYIRLRRGPAASALHELNGKDSKYDIFFLHEPTEKQQVQSVARACLGLLLDIEGIFRAFKVAVNNSASTPFILEHVPERYPGENREPRDCGMPATSTTTAEDDLAISGLTFGAIKELKDHKLRELDALSTTQATMRAAVTMVKHVEDESGIIARLPHVRPWENAPVTLPEGARLASLPTAELPRDTVDLLNTKIGIICSALGIPQEFLLGQSRNRISTSTFAEEQLQSTVHSGRKFLEDAMVTMYWRIYWNEHARHAIQFAGTVDHEMSSDEIADMIDNIDVNFTFKSRRITYEEARVLFSDGVINGDTLKRIAMEQHCLRSTDMESGQPTVGREQQQQSTSDGGDGSSEKTATNKRKNPDSDLKPKTASSRVDSGENVGFETHKKQKVEGDAIEAVK